MILNAQEIWNYALAAIPELLAGLPYTVAISLVAFVFGSLLGLILCYLRLKQIPFLNGLVKLYISFIRGTPLLVQIFLGYYAIPILITSISPNSAIASVPAIYFVFVSFSLSEGAYLSEVFRSAFEAVPQGQIEAAYTIGLSQTKTFTKVILPEALVSALPNLGNMFLILVKDTSLAFSVTVPEIIGQAQTIAGRTSRFLEVYTLAALIYWVICLALEWGFARLEKRVTKFKRGVAND